MNMTQEKQRDEAIRKLVNVLRVTPFTMEFKVKKKPFGVRITYEVTQEEMDAMIERAANGQGQSQPQGL